MDDPFDCFDSDSDEEEGNTDAKPKTDTAASQHSASPVATRDPLCGVLTFHSGTEQSLLNYVERELESSHDDPSIPPSKKVLNCIDEFCYSRHWMMHCGDEKAETLKGFLQEFCQASFRDNNIQPWNLLELGTYCGYSAIFCAQTILETHPSAPFHIVSVDVDANHQRVAQKLIQLAQLENYISLVLLPVHSQEDKLLTKYLREHYFRSQPTTIHFLFIDHDKDLYVSDLRQLEETGWIQKGTHVAADNVVFFDIPYRNYIQDRVNQGIVSSRLVEGRLEYSKSEQGANNGELKDGIGRPFPDFLLGSSTMCGRLIFNERCHFLYVAELTVYLKTPHSKA